jgi:hypothetical protein
MVLLAFCVGLSVVPTSTSQAAEPENSTVPDNTEHRQQVSAESRPRSAWSIDLAGKIKNWKRSIQIDSDGEGVNLSRPFGTRGPALLMSGSVPETTQTSLRAGGDNGIGRVGVDAPGPYLFLHKRW